MDGVEVLNISSTLIDGGVLYYCIFVVAIFIIVGCVLLINGVTTVLFTYTTVCVLCFLVTFGASKTSHTIITIKVTGKVDRETFHNTYEVLSKEGNIYKVKEREK